MKKSDALDALLEMDRQAANISNRELAGVIFNLQDIPSEIRMRLINLCQTTRRIGGKTVRVGKIVVINILDAIRKNPNTAIGVVLAACISVLVTQIPWLGLILAPIVAILSGWLFAASGYRLDRQERGENVDGSSILGDAIKLMRAFLAFLIAVFQSVAKEIRQ